MKTAEIQMKLSPLLFCLLALGPGQIVLAEPSPAAPTSEPSAAPSGTAPPMSDMPGMKQQGERMAVLMEQLSKESDPAQRRKIMSEMMCPQ